MKNIYLHVYRYLLNYHIPGFTGQLFFFELNLMAVALMEGLISVVLYPSQPLEPSFLRNIYIFMLFPLGFMVLVGGFWARGFFRWGYVFAVLDWLLVAVNHPLWWLPNVAFAILLSIIVYGTIKYVVWEEYRSTPLFLRTWWGQRS